MRSIITFFLLVSISIFAQDSTRSEAFRDNFPRKYPLIKAKYPSYSLIAGYVLVTEANRNDPYAEHELGLRYLLANGFQADTAKAIYWIRKAVDQNLPAARFNYGIMLYNGIGVPGIHLKHIRILRLPLMQVYRMHNLQLDYHTQTIFYSIEI